MKSTPTTAASQILNHFLPLEDSTVVRRLRDAKAIILGKSNMDEFGMGSFNIHGYKGTHVLNPLNNEYVCGGSSGGSAASILLGNCPIAIGADSGGSIRLPAHCCGLYGFKPSYGTISRHGLINYISSTDTPSLLGSNIDDIEAIYSNRLTKKFL